MVRTAAVATVPTVPWDVPVRIVPLPSAVGVRRVRRVRLDGAIALPGVAALDVVTRRVPATEQDVLTDVLPVRGAPDRVPGGPGDASLADLLEVLTVADAVPVAVEGSAFVRDVLAALIRVPLGERRTYAGLAADVGRPRAVRAVASVMARNRVPLVLPCHRIVPSSGGTGRYGWGDAIKVALLDIESHA